VRGEPLEALAGGEPAPGALAGGPKGGHEEARHRPRQAEVELGPRPHLRSVLRACPGLGVGILQGVDLAAQGDAGGGLGARDPVAEVAAEGAGGRDEPGLLVGDAPLAHGLAQLRQFVETPRERGALLHGAGGHPEPLLGVVAEGGEAHVAP
jgi:hypothetical protein